MLSLAHRIILLYKKKKYHGSQKDKYYYFFSILYFPRIIHSLPLFFRRNQIPCRQSASYILFTNTYFPYPSCIACAAFYSDYILLRIEHENSSTQKNCSLDFPHLALCNYNRSYCLFDDLALLFVLIFSCLPK